ncbi:MAG: DUF1223 domain-containing protein [Verrucomicrobia bacterium]|nr:DUF1223 domain-containing protein [Verrucomicrobiota bacterium]
MRAELTSPSGWRRPGRVHRAGASVTALVLWLAAGPGRGGDPAATGVRFQSGLAAVPLLELYTSEGCNSCPPAEAWFSTLQSAPGLWKGFVPVALHVDYWDSQEWKDGFALPECGSRQRAYASQWQSPQGYYTPEFIWRGMEWRGWYAGQSLPLVPSLSAGVLTLSSTTPPEWTAVFTPTRPGLRSFDLHAALLGFDLRAQVTGGENRGRTLRHDFVALALTTVPMVWTNGTARADFRLPPRADVVPRRLAAVAWITLGHHLEPVQAVGGWLQSGSSAPSVGAK